jgi:SpoVK/Ycf46/Vps4 family AAA+-type ATPase
LAILTTNMKNALDPAFLRRLRFIITFGYPGAAERERIWRNIFPSVPGVDPARPGFLVPGADRLDFQTLARASLTGGQIRNIAVNGAFLAAAGDGTVTMELLREAARDELRKHGKPIAAADFIGWLTPAATSAPPDQLLTPEAGEVH